MPTALAYKKRGHPIRGEELVRTTFHWRYWCDICGKYLHDKEGVYRPAGDAGRAGGWCLECARAYDFLDLRPSRSNPGDLDQIEAIYHFTDSQNLVSVRRLGILSLDELRQRGITPTMTSTESSRQRDNRSELSGYVRLALHPHHPMAWKALYEARSLEVTWLEVDTAVLQQVGTKYSDRNALASDRTVGTSPRIATRGTDQAEVMVVRVPPEAILGVTRKVSI